MLYYLYNADQKAASFTYDKGLISDYAVIQDQLLPMQIRAASADGFAQWLRERAIDLNTFLHRQFAISLMLFYFQDYLHIPQTNKMLSFVLSSFAQNH